LRNALAARFPALLAFDYGKLLLERKAAEGIKIDYPELREKSSSVISPADVGSVDDWVIQRVNELRQHSNVVLDSHALTAETYGLRAIPVSSVQLQKLKLDAVLVLRCDPTVFATSHRQLSTPGHGRR
jgi:adenylate kinase